MRGIKSGALVHRSIALHRTIRALCHRGYGYVYSRAGASEPARPQKVVSVTGDRAPDKDADYRSRNSN